MLCLWSARTPASCLWTVFQPGKQRRAQPSGQGRAPTPGKATVTPKPDVAGMSETSVPLSPNMTFFARISGTQCKCLLDTGSSISVLNQNVLEMIPNAPKLRKTAVRAKTATQEELPLSGRVSLCFHIGYSAPEGPFSVEDRRRCCNHLPQRSSTH